jgi:predicted nucleotidyltransferase
MAMNIDRELLKEELLKSPFLDLAKATLKPNDEIIGIFLAGSRAANIAALDSDIDVAILTLNS